MNKDGTPEVVNSDLVKKDGKTIKILALILVPILLVVLFFLTTDILTLYTPFIFALWF